MVEHQVRGCICIRLVAKRIFLRLVILVMIQTSQEGLNSLRSLCQKKKFLISEFLGLIVYCFLFWKTEKNKENMFGLSGFILKNTTQNSKNKKGF